jgi:hypothetical protein
MRKNATDLTIEYLDLNRKVLACGARIEARAQELVKQYPDLNIKKDTTSDDMITTQQWFEIIDFHASTNGTGHADFTVNSFLTLIKFIEDHIAGLHPHQQQKLF